MIHQRTDHPSTFRSMHIPTHILYIDISATIHLHLSTSHHPPTTYATPLIPLRAYRTAYRELDRVSSKTITKSVAKPESTERTINLTSDGSRFTLCMTMREQYGQLPRQHAYSQTRQASQNMHYFLPFFFFPPPPPPPPADAEVVLPCVIPAPMLVIAPFFLL